MHFFQVLNDELGCASYLLADGDEAIVVDPRWDIDVYLELAAQHGARITHAIDTHDHADHVSGRGRLARASGAVAAHPGAGIEAGDVLRAGRIRLEAVATPGHRPEHLAFVVVDETRGDEPWCVLSGDSLLVGDVARPDLAVDAGEGAEALHESLQRIFALGDHVELWPGHVGGSLCGGAGLSPKTSSTIGFERLSASPAALEHDPFVGTICGATPPKPPNIERIVALNKGPLDAEPSVPELLDAEGLRAELGAGATVVDIRPAGAFDSGHLSGALSLPPSPGRVTRVGWAAADDEPIVVVGEDAQDARAFAGALHAIGLWSVRGIAAADAQAWRAAGLPVSEAEAWDIERLAAALGEGDIALVDVREAKEWASGHVPGSVPLPLHRLGDGRVPVPGLNGGPIAVACAAGARAALAASILRRAGHPQVIRVAGGGIGDLPVALERGA
ncbi:MAG: rhodanese-like domain-containing protein [Solirubrobacteraceae bacterium]